MVSKSLTIIALLLCAILAQTAAAKKEESKDEASDGSGSEDSDGVSEDDDDDEEEEDEDDVKYPSLSCLIFKNIGCNSECEVIGNAFNTKSGGTCADDNVCECNVAKKTYFDNKDARKFIKNGKPDITAIEKHVSNKLPSTLKSADIKELSALKYEKSLQDALEKAKDDSDAFDQLVVDIRRTKNKSLGEILSQYFKKNKLKEPVKDAKDKSSVADIMAYYVVDELVKKVDGKKPTKTAKKPANKPATKGGKTPVKKPSKKSTDDADDFTSLKDRFELEDFDDSELKRNGPLNKNWRTDKYKVSYQRSWAGDVNMNWIKGADKVSIQKAVSSAVNQSWTFGKENVRISISISASNAINENWNFGASKYQYSKSASGYVNSNWSSGKSDNKLLKKYQRFIDAWCDANDSFIQKSYCVIYKK